MKPREIFSVIVKTAGLIVLLLGAFDFLNLLTLPGVRDIDHLPVGRMLFGSLVKIIFGLALMRFDNVLLDWAYSERLFLDMLPTPPPLSKVQSQAKPQPEPEPTTGIRCVSCHAVIPEGAKVCPKCGWTQPG